MSVVQTITNLLKNTGWVFDAKKQVWCNEKFRIPNKTIQKVTAKNDLAIACNQIISILGFAKNSPVVSKTIKSLQNQTMVATQ